MTRALAQDWARKPRAPEIRLRTLELGLPKRHDSMMNIKYFNPTTVMKRICALQDDCFSIGFWMFHYFTWFLCLLTQIDNDSSTPLLSWTSGFFKWTIVWRFTKLKTLNFHMGGSILNKMNHAANPSDALDSRHDVQFGTTWTRAWSQDDGSSKQISSNED